MTLWRSFNCNPSKNFCASAMESRTTSWTFTAFFVVQLLGVRDLDGNIAISIRVVTEIDRAHAATAYFAHHLVLAQACRDLSAHVLL